MKHIKFLYIISIFFTPFLANAQFVEEGNSTISTSADAFYPVSDGNSVTFYRQTGGVREAAFVISATGDKRIDIRGHTNIKSLYLNGKILFDEDGTYFGSPLSNKNISESAIDSEKVKNNSLTEEDLAPNSVGTSELVNGSVKSIKIDEKAINGKHIGYKVVTSYHLDRKSVSKEHLAPLEIVNIIEKESRIGIKFAYCPHDSILISGGCRSSSYPIKVSRGVYDKHLSGWECGTQDGPITAYATCLKGLPVTVTKEAPL